MEKTLLTANQQQFLSVVDKNPSLYTHFYFTGGTCLSEYYLQHRFSEDLDFFSENEFNSTDISSLLKKEQKNIGYKEIDFQQSFNRNIYQIIYNNSDILKVEFTYFPFQRIDTTSKKNNIFIDSLKDIAVNKVFTIMQNPRGRDFYDIYFILKKHPEWLMEDLLKLARIKFDFRIDYLQFGANLLKVETLKDDPILSDKIDHNEIQLFFLEESKKIKDKFIQSD